MTIQEINRLKIQIKLDTLMEVIHENMRKMEILIKLLRVEEENEK